jgi:hypothetical protein
MGWWKVEGTQNVIGDAPLDALGQAVQAVVMAYQTAFQRRPTRQEWEALLLGALGAEDPALQIAEDGIINGVRLDSEAR